MFAFEIKMLRWDAIDGLDSVDRVPLLGNLKLLELLTLWIYKKYGYFKVPSLKYGLQI